MQHSLRFNAFILTVSIAAITLMLNLSAFAVSIEGTWHLEGARFTGDQTVLNPLSRLWGTVQISGGQLVFSTNQGSFTKAVALVDYGTFQESVLNETAPHPIEGQPPLLTSSTRVRILVEDDDTLVLAFGRTLYEEGTLRNFSSYEWIGGVLTTAPVRARITPFTKAPAWAGKYSRTTASLSEDNFRTGISASMTHRKSQFVSNPGGGFLVVHDDGPQSLGATADFATLASARSDSTREHLWSNPVMNSTVPNGPPIGTADAYLVAERDERQAFHLGDGRVLFIQAYARRAEGVVTHFDPLIPSYSYFFIPDADMDCMLMTQNAIGHVSLVYPANGAVIHVIRDGQKFPLVAGNPLYEGDVIQTVPGSGCRVDFVDLARMTISPDSVVKIERFSSQRTTFHLLKGWLREIFTTGPNKSRFEFVTSKTAGGVRGTEFDWGYTEDGGIGTTTFDVLSGIVDMTNLETGQVHEVLAGQSRSVAVPVLPASVTIQVPGQGLGSVSINGTMVNVFPHTFTAPVGTELNLLALPAANKEFHRWWGAQETLTAPLVHIVSGDTVLNCEFKLPGYDAEDAYYDAVDALGLSGGATEEDAIPFSDGVPNVIKWAFNMNLGAADHRRLDFGAPTTAGLPAFRVAGSAQFRYLRRTDGSVIYRPLVSTDLTTWEPFTGTESVQPQVAGWEQVTLSSPLPPTGSAGQFFRVQVALPVSSN